MPTPFPGMDPYLEQTRLWPDVHNRLIVSLADDLAPRLRPRYYVSIEERTYRQDPGGLRFSGRVDVAVIDPPKAKVHESSSIYVTVPVPVTVTLPMSDEIVETYLEVRASGNNRVIVLLEILSPSNKRPGEGRRQYLRKRLEVLGTETHLVEIDLLRAGEAMPMRGENLEGDYRILISRQEHRPDADLFLFTVRQQIPAFRLPLQEDDQEPKVEINSLLHQLYERAGYDLRIDYSGEPDHPLIGNDAAWARKLLREYGS